MGRLVQPLVQPLRQRLVPVGPSSGAGGGGSTVPSWVEALRAPSGDLPLFAYNFANGGSGQGWDGTNNATLTVAQTWEAAPWGSWNTTSIIDGLGLSDTGQSPVTKTGILPGSTLAGATLLVEARVYGDATIDTGGWVFAHLVDLPGDNGEGGADLRWSAALDRNVLSVTSADGLPGVNDTITGKVSRVRGVVNYTVDGNDLVGSANGRTNVTGPGAVRVDGPNTVAPQNNGGGTDIPVYLTLVAVYALQSPTALPTLSAL